MEIEIAKKYRVIDASRFEDEHGIKNGHEFFVDSLDDDRAFLIFFSFLGNSNFCFSAQSRVNVPDG